MSEDTLRETFCKNLSRILKERKMTQRDFAKAVGVSAATANEWLKGKKMPLMGRIDTICSVLSIDRSDLMAAPAPPAAQPPTAPYHPELTKRDERDIEKRLQAIRDDLDADSGVAFMGGQEMTDTDKEYMMAALESGIRAAKLLAKKYTPKKYRKDGGDDK